MTTGEQDHKMTIIARDPLIVLLISWNSIICSFPTLTATSAPANSGQLTYFMLSYSSKKKWLQVLLFVCFVKVRQ